MHITVHPLTLENIKLLLTKLELCYVGDPCYVFPDAHWTTFCNALFDVPDEENILAAMDRVKQDRAKHNLPAMSDEDLRDMAEVYASQSSPRKALIFSVDGGPGFIVSSTAYGDGYYPVTHVDADGNVTEGHFGVDAGLFSVIPLSLLQVLDPTGAAKAGEWRNQNHRSDLGPMLPFDLSAISQIVNPQRGNLQLESNGEVLAIRTSS